MHDAVGMQIGHGGEQNEHHIPRITLTVGSPLHNAVKELTPLQQFCHQIIHLLLLVGRERLSRGGGGRSDPSQPPYALVLHEEAVELQHVRVFDGTQDVHFVVKLLLLVGGHVLQHHALDGHSGSRFQMHGAVHGAECALAQLYQRGGRKGERVIEVKNRARHTNRLLKEQ